jgi:hypothetical protein
MFCLLNKRFIKKRIFDTNLVGGVGVVRIERQRISLKSESSTLRTVIIVNKRFMKHVKFDTYVVGGVGGGTQSSRYASIDNIHRQI